MRVLQQSLLTLEKRWLSFCTSDSFISYILVCTSALENSQYSSNQDIESQPKACSFDVGNIQTKTVIKFQLRAADDLPQSCESWHYIQSMRVPEFIGLRSKRSRPRTNKAHLAAQHIEQLW